MKGEILAAGSRVCSQSSFQRLARWFFGCILTSFFDEATRIHHCNSETKQQSKKVSWWPRFWKYVRRIIDIEYLEEGRALNGNYYLTFQCFSDIKKQTSTFSQEEISLPLIMSTGARLFKFDGKNCGIEALIAGVSIVFTILFLPQDVF